MSFSGFFGAGANDFTAFGVSLLPSNVVFGSNIAIDATLTLIADPSSTIDLPRFRRAYRCRLWGPAHLSEPASLVLMGFAAFVLLGQALWCRARLRSRSSSPSCRSARRIPSRSPTARVASLLQRLHHPGPGVAPICW